MADRVHKSLLNAKVNLIFYFLSLFFSFFSRKIFLDCLGVEFIGLTGTLGNILGYLNLAELYFAIDNDDENVSMFLDLARDVLENETLTDGYYAFVCEKSAPAFEKLGRNEYADQLRLRARSIYERN